MIRSLLKLMSYLVAALLIVVILLATFNRPKQETFSHYGLPPTVQTLQQNWSSDIRQQLIHTSFGSHIIPLDWFLALEHPNKKGLLADPVNLKALGFIPQLHATNNTYGLPVGFSITQHEHKPWVGLTCAACHTGSVQYKGKVLLIDGGPGLIDFAGFEHTLLGAIEQTLNDADKLERFNKAISSNSAQDLKLALIQRRDYLSERLAYNATATPYGYGRLDAFGIIFNSIAVEALGIPTNARAPDAPVSIPVLWDASHLDLVQWNGTAPNKEPGPLGQNIPTAIAVYGHVDLKNDAWLGYSNSVNVKNLGYLQRQYYQLLSPVWPQSLLGATDPDLVDEGKHLYKQQCLGCHAITDSSDGKRQIETTLVDLSVIGTDPVMAKNFVERTVDSGLLAGKKQAVILGPKMPPQVPSIDPLVNATVGIMINKPISVITAIMTEFAHNKPATPNFKRLAYKARPLNGIWASAPYLHNGSVPTLWDLLQSPELRPRQFYVGDNTLDVKKVGYLTAQTEYSSLFDTALYGNSNSGHLYGTDLKESEKWALIEYLKSL